MPHVSSAIFPPECDAEPKNEATPEGEVNTSESLGKVSDVQESRHESCIGDGSVASWQMECSSKSVLDRTSGSQMSPAPPLPKKKDVVKKIEVLCQFIAKNGPHFEDMARRRENGNPEFEFLFGGEPGSDAALAHDYFLWMKRKYLSTDNSQEDGQFSTSMPLNGSSASQSEHLMLLPSADVNADSDMEMEG